jgi:paraquat-inducible protein B
MASPRANPALIGLFVIGALALAAVSVVVFGSGRIFEERTLVVTYFEGAVTGLDVGAPVIFHGVKIGGVTKIDAMIEAESFEVLVRVFFELVEGSVETIGNADLTGHAAVARFIEKGLRAQLKSQSLITGKLYLDLGRHPDSEIVLQKLDPNVPEIPSVPMTFEVLGRELRDLVDRVRKLPLEKMIEDLASTVAGLNVLVNKPETGEVIDNLNQTLERAEQLIGRLDERVDDVADQLELAVRDISEAAAAAEQTLVTVQTTVEPGSALNHELMETLLELQATLRSLRSLTDEMAEQPEQVIFGRPKEKEAP